MKTVVLTRRHEIIAGVFSLVLLYLGIRTVTADWFGSMAFFANGVPSRIDPVSRWPFWAASVVTAACPVLALRRPWSAFVLSTALPALLVATVHLAMNASFLGLLAVAFVATATTPRTSWVMAVLALALPACLFAGAQLLDGRGNPIYLHHMDEASWPYLLRWYIGRAVVAVAAAHVLAFTVRAVEERERLAERERLLGLDSALLAERARLALDLHDVVTHHVSVIAVRAETAPYTVPNLSEAARTTFVAIADDSRRALDELRGVLGVLRRPDGSVDIAPQPTGSDVGGLLAEARSMADVSYEGDEHLRALEGAAGYVAYRVVQEALTNARRHAPGEAVAIVASRSEEDLVLRVSNRADGVVAVVPGRGLTGMRERVEAVGGTMAAEVRGGDVVVEVRLP